MLFSATSDLDPLNEAVSHRLEFEHGLGPDILRRFGLALGGLTGLLQFGEELEHSVSPVGLLQLLRVWLLRVALETDRRSHDVLCHVFQRFKQDLFHGPLPFNFGFFSLIDRGHFFLIIYLFY